MYFYFFNFTGYGDLSVSPFTYRKKNDINEITKNENKTNIDLLNAERSKEEEEEDGDACVEGNILTPNLEIMAKKGIICLFIVMCVC